MITKLNKNYDLKENANYILEREKNILYSKYFTYGGKLCSQTKRLDHTQIINSISNFICEPLSISFLLTMHG